MGIFYLHLHSYSSHAKTWLSIRKTGFRKRLKFSTSHFIRSECSFVFFLNRLTANERSQTSKAVLEIEADAVIYMHTYILSIQVFWERLSDKVRVTTPKGIVGCFWVHCFSRKFERMAGEAMDICLWVLKESNKSRFDSYSVRNSVLIISHITFRDCRVHIFSDNLSRNSCIHTQSPWWFKQSD